MKRFVKRPFASVQENAQDADTLEHNKHDEECAGEVQHLRRYHAQNKGSQRWSVTFPAHTKQKAPPAHQKNSQSTGRLSGRG